MLCITLTVLISLGLAVGAHASASSQDTFTVLDALADSVCPAERRLTEVQATSDLSCMAQAARWSDCTGVSYDGNNNMCYICDTYVETLPGSFPSLTGATFYHRSKVVPAGYTHVVDGHLLKIVPSLATNYSQAESACAEWAWGALVRIDTPTKQEAIRAYLAGLSGNRYWIQAQDSDEDGVWSFDDGTTIPLTSEYWALNQPDFPWHRCAYMWRSEDYFWDNSDCGYEYGYICEMILY